MRRLGVLFAAILSITFSCFAQPKREVRAVWLTTNAGLDWPKGNYNAAKQQENLRVILDELAAININTIIFQAQVKGDVLWNSKIQPFYRYVSGNGSRAMTYDVAKFVVDECHKRGMECHAWVAPYRLGSSTYYNAYSSNPVVKHPAELHPEWLVNYSGDLFFDPGLPEVRDYLVEVYHELIANYDFDGISFDYCRYPGKDFDDAASFAEYNPNGLPLADWRRENINTFMAQLYDMAKSVKPRFKVGSSPIGTYKNAPGYGNMSGYNQVYQDAPQWMTSGHHDLVVPMMYYAEKNGFTVHMNQWASVCGGRQIAIGLAPYKLVDANNWDVSVITNQIDITRTTDGISGVAFFRTDHVIGSDTKIQDLYNELHDVYFTYPAHIPPMDYNGVTAPATPQNVFYTREGNDYIITWDKNDDELSECPTKYYEVYLASANQVDVNDMRNVVGHQIVDNKFVYTTEEEGLLFAVSAFDANYYESAPSIAAGAGEVTVESRPTRYAFDGYRLKINADRPLKFVDVYTLIGHRPLHVKVKDFNEYTLDMSALSAGFYLIRVTYDDNTTETKKVIVG